MKRTSRVKSTMTMLEYCKLLLNKISFNKELLLKEYEKGLKYLNPVEREELRQFVELKVKEIE